MVLTEARDREVREANMLAQIQQTYASLKEYPEKGQPSIERVCEGVSVQIGPHPYNESALVRLKQQDGLVGLEFLYERIKDKNITRIEEAVFWIGKTWELSSLMVFGSKMSFMRPNHMTGPTKTLELRGEVPEDRELLGQAIFETFLKRTHHNSPNGLEMIHEKFNQRQLL